MPLAQPVRGRGARLCPGRKRFLESAQPVATEVRDWIAKIRARRRGIDSTEQAKGTRAIIESIKNAHNLVATTADDAGNQAVSFVDGRNALIDHVIVSSDVRLGRIQGDDTAIARLDRSVASFAPQVSDRVSLVFRMIFDPSDNPPPPNGDATANRRFAFLAALAN